MDIRIIGDTIEIDYRPVAMILPQASATQREDMAQAVEYAAAYEKLEEEHNAKYDKAEEEGYERGYAAAEAELTSAHERELDDNWKKAQNEIKEKYAALVEAASKVTREYYSLTEPLDAPGLILLIEALGEALAEAGE